MKHISTVIGFVFILAACDGSTGPRGGGNVAIQFSTTSSPGIAANLLSSGFGGPASADLTVTGTNGTLVIQDIRLIVSELELRSSADASCTGHSENENENEKGNRSVATDRKTSGSNNSNDNKEGDDCEFEGGPFLVNLPLNGTASIATETIPAGTYDSFKFKMEDLAEDDGDDSADKAHIPEVLAEMRTFYPNFPSRASMVVKGTQNGQPFTVYFDSKMKIQSPLSPPLVVPGDKVLTVKIDPATWFLNGTQVMDLLALNGKLVDLKSKVRGGMKGAHRGDG